MQIPNIENTGIENEGVNPSSNVGLEQTPEIHTVPAPVEPVEAPKVEEVVPVQQNSQELPISVGYPINGEQVGDALGKIKSANLSREAIETLAKKIKGL